MDNKGLIVGCGKSLQEKVNDGTYVEELKDYERIYKSCS